jgi:hypothetical protein
VVITGPFDFFTTSRSEDSWTDEAAPPEPAVPTGSGVAGAGGGAFCSVSSREQPFKTAAAEITALRIMNFLRSKPAGTSGESVLSPASSGFASFSLDMEYLLLKSFDQFAPSLYAKVHLKEIWMR